VRLSATGDELSELLVPLDEERSGAAERLIEQPRLEDARYALLGPALEWLAQTLRIAEAGRLTVLDRWSAVTSALASGEVPPLAFDQLSAVRRPIEQAPVEIFPEMAVVSWRLG